MHEILIVAPRLKVIVKLIYLGAEFETECATFQRSSKGGLDHALVVACNWVRSQAVTKS